MDKFYIIMLYIFDILMWNIWNVLCNNYST